MANRSFLFFFLCASLLFCCSFASAATVLFSMEDPEGDGNGAGTYQYPTHEAFSPKLFDLRHFLVSTDEDNIYFDAVFPLVTNPWNAPEGFFHQLVDIFIDAIPGKGWTEAKGPNVNFPVEYAWDYRIRMAPFSGSRLFFATENVQSVPLSAIVLPDNRTIRAVVPSKLLRPSASWRYYVLVGSFDFFGPENYRQVEETAGKWTFGGGGTNYHPRVIDLLAPARGKSSQAQQLTGFDVSAETLAVLTPLSMKEPTPIWIYITPIFLALLGGAAYWWKRRHSL